MLPKKNKADKKEIEQIFKKGQFFSFSSLSFRYIKSKGKAKAKISFIAPKTVSKTAVKRNYLRRLGYSALKEHTKDFPAGLIGVFMFRKYQDDKAIIENEIKETLNKIH